MVAGKNFLTTLLRTSDHYSVSFALNGQSYAGTVQEIEGNFRILGNAGTPFEGMVMTYMGQEISDGSSVSSNILMTQGIADRLNTYLDSALTPVRGGCCRKRRFKIRARKYQRSTFKLNRAFLKGERGYHLSFF